MRKQYHFRPSENGYYAWDVDNLIELSKNFEVKQIPLDSIEEFDENYWFNGKDDNPSCRAITEHFKLVKETNLSYPIILSHDGKIMDGMHRVCKAFLENRTTIKALQFNKDPLPDYENVHPDDLPYDEEL